MAKIESKKVYVRLESSDVIEAKRNTLKSFANIINMLVISKKFRRLGKDALLVAEQGKRTAEETINDINKLQEELPQKEKQVEKHGEKIEVRKEKFGKHISKAERYRMELEDIKERLAELGT